MWSLVTVSLTVVFVLSLLTVGPFHLVANETSTAVSPLLVVGNTSSPEAAHPLWTQPPHSLQVCRLKCVSNFTA